MLGKVEEMEKSELIGILKKILGGQENLDFLGKLEEAEIKKLVMLIRERVGERKQVNT